MTALITDKDHVAACAEYLTVTAPLADLLAHSTTSGRSRTHFRQMGLILGIHWDHFVMECILRLFCYDYFLGLSFGICCLGYAVREIIVS